MDQQFVSALVRPDGDFAQLRTALGKARARAIKNLGLARDTESIPDGCAATLSALLQLAGLDVGLENGAGNLVAVLEEPAGRGWIRVDVGQQRSGDVGVTFDRRDPPGADHVYLVAHVLDSDRMLIADNQARDLHTRLASGGGKTPTAYFLRAPGPLDAPPPLVSATDAALSGDRVTAILEFVDAAAIRRYSWHDDQAETPPATAPRGYLLGMAVGFAHLYHRLGSDVDVQAMAAPVHLDRSTTDALAYYADRFKAVGMPLNDDPRDILRHLFVLLTGLGMRESTGRYCLGRDQQANNVDSDTAEAGLFQVSYNLVRDKGRYDALRARYRDSTALRKVFSLGVACADKHAENWGTDPDGIAFQQLTKQCPAFAIEIAALGLRHRRQHWGPINERKAHLASEWDQVLQHVQDIVDGTAL